MSYPAFSSEQHHSVEMTIDRSSGFAGEVRFDLGVGVHPVLLQMTLLSVTPDSETFGTNSGDLFVGQGTSTLVLHNHDGGANFVSPPFVSPVDHYVSTVGSLAFEFFDDPVDTVVSAMLICARCLVVHPAIAANTGGLDYAGANNPAVTLQLDLSFR